MAGEYGQLFQIKQTIAYSLGCIAGDTQQCTSFLCVSPLMRLRKSTQQRLTVDKQLGWRVRLHTWRPRCGSYCAAAQRQFQWCSYAEIEATPISVLRYVETEAEAEAEAEACGGMCQR